MMGASNGTRFEVAVVGAGLGGALLAWLLARSGRRVLLVERGRHPRRALGESSTPLAALALERLAARFDLPELAALGRWGEAERRLPELRRGLKRGFTFYGHRPGELLAPPGHELQEGPDLRLLVAASPSEEIADSHWWRADLDQWLTEQAREAGAVYRDRTEVHLLGLDDEGAQLELVGEGERETVTAHALVDASGAGGFLAQALDLGVSEPDLRTDTALLAGHWRFDRGGEPWGPPPGAEAPSVPGAPYPEGRAAVHHLLEEGWIYALPFDPAPDGAEQTGTVRVSLGLELLRPLDARVEAVLRQSSPEESFQAVVERYPSLAAQLADGRPDGPVTYRARVQHRLSRAAGPGWVILPQGYAFASPLYSTGIAWTLLGVERALDLLTEGDGLTAEAAGRYQDLLATEATWIDRLVAGALSARRDGALFTPWTFLYLAAASFAEARQRLSDPPSGSTGARSWAWEPFLGAGDPVLRRALAGAEERLERALATAPGSPERRSFRPWMAEALASRDLVGFDREGDLVPVDLDLLVERAGLLGLCREEVLAALPRLRGAPSSPSLLPPG